MAGYSIFDPTTTDPKKQIGQSRTQLNDSATQAEQERQQRLAYLDPIMQKLASGQGGYSPEELSQIRMTPEQQQNIVDAASQDIGAKNASDVQAAEMATNAAGGNPAALAAFRNRVTRQNAAEQGDAATRARVAASNAAAGREEDIGKTRLGQQDTGLGYYSGLESQANQNRQQDMGTMAGLTSQGLQAAAQPSTFDKIMGGVTGALGAIKLEDGGDAVVGDGGPEKVITTNPQPAAPWWKTAANSVWQNMRQPTDRNTMPATPAPARAWSPVETYRALGQLGGQAANVGRRFLEDGGEAEQGTNGVFTEPTRVHLDPGDKAVPLDFKREARMRPSMANMPPAPIRQRREFSGPDGPNNARYGG